VAPPPVEKTHRSDMLFRKKSFVFQSEKKSPYLTNDQIAQLADATCRPVLYIVRAPCVRKADLERSGMG